MNISCNFLFIIFSLFVFSGVLYSSAYAAPAPIYQEKEKPNGNYYWLLFGYSDSETEDKSLAGLTGPINLTIGGELYNFLGLEITLAGRWNTQNIFSNYGGSDVPVTNTLWSFDIKPYLILQPNIGIDLISFRPYIGIGPSFHVTGLNSTTDISGSYINSSSSAFNVGFSAKTGYRLQILYIFFLGMGVEFLYHNTRLNNNNYNLSGWTMGAEAGIILYF